MGLHATIVTVKALFWGALASIRLINVDMRKDDVVNDDNVKGVGGFVVSGVHVSSAAGPAERMGIPRPECTCRT